MGKRNFVLVLEEDGNGQPWLLVEPHQDIGLPPNTHITLRLPDGADVEDAERLAKLVNETVETIKLSKF